MPPVMNATYVNGTQVKNESKLELTSIDVSFKQKNIWTQRTLTEKIAILIIAVLVIIVIGLSIGLGVANSKSSAQQSAQDICVTGGCAEAATRLMSNLDQTVAPCDDFFQFACGQWRRQHVIPEDRSSLDVFGALRDELEIILKYLLEEPVIENEPEAVTKVKNLYTSCMNTSLIEERAIAVSYPLLAELGGWPVLESKPGGNWSEDRYDLSDLLVSLIKYNNKPIIEFYAYTDLKNSSTRILYLDQPGFGMPGREYYTKSRTDPMVLAYEELAKSAAIAFGADPTVAETMMREMVDFEVELAHISSPAEDRRDSEALYNKMTLRELKENFTEPASIKFDWMRYVSQTLLLEGVNITTDEEENIVVRAIPYLQKLFPVLEKYGNRAVANYLVWRIMQNRINNLGVSFEELLKKYNKVVYGTESQRARWRRCGNYVNSNMGLAVGRLFVDERFKESAKSETLDMIKRLKVSFKELLDDVSWMDAETRKVAIEKVDYIEDKIGYQPNIKDKKLLDEMYENYTINADKYFENVLGIINRISVDSFRLLRQDVNKTWWTTAPATVNAYYNSLLNRIMFPAGILQPPFFGQSQPRSMNYGGIGVVIGHEITHGFDDRGREYDKDGNLQRWWSDDAIRKFVQAKQCIIDQYGNFSVPEADGLKVNGINTQGENIADNGGLKQSYQAYKQWEEEMGFEQPLPGVPYDHDQIFFINFAQIWCANMRRESAINAIRTGVHSPGRFRVIGTLQNFPAFSEAFGCPLGSNMNPGKKCAVW